MLLCAMPWLRFRFCIEKDWIKQKICCHYPQSMGRSTLPIPFPAQIWVSSVKAPKLKSTTFPAPAAQREWKRVTENYGNFLPAFERCCLLIFYAWYRMNDAFIFQTEFSSENGNAQKENLSLDVEWRRRRKRRILSSS